MRGHINYLHG